MAEFPTKDPDAHHDFAHSIMMKRDIHISEVTERGRKGYLCIGCQREMQAVLPEKSGYRRYFRHDARFVKSGEKCTFKDEEYRRKLAITTLELNKQIRVPPLYKFPPKAIEGLALFLRPGEVISAAKVEKDKYFYEGANGNVESSFDYDGAIEDILFKADVIFYNENDEPVLFIRIGKRNKLKPEEYAGLKRLRVNAINLTIPKDSPEAIEISQKKGDRTKWIYHDDEQQIAYFSVPTDLGEGIPSADGYDDRLSEESYDCRKVQLSNLIRALSRCLESKPYLETERGVREAIGKTELAIRRAEERRANLEERYRAAAEAAHKRESNEIDERGIRFRTAKADFNRYYKDIQERYHSKKCELTETTRLLEAEIRQEEIAFGGTGKTSEQLRRELEREHERVRNQMVERFERELRSITREQERVERVIATERGAIERIRSDVGSAPAYHERKQHDQRSYHDRVEAEEREVIRRLEADENGREERLTGGRADLTARFDELRSGSAITAEKRDTSGSTIFSKRLKALSDARRLVLAISDDKTTIRRILIAKEFIKTGAFEAWISKHQHRRTD